jgi:hypothetical protein
LSFVERDKGIMEKALGKAVRNFPNSMEVRGFVQKYKDMFKDCSTIDDLCISEDSDRTLTVHNDEENSKGLSDQDEIPGLWTQEAMEAVNIAEECYSALSKGTENNGKVCNLLIW